MDSLLAPIQDAMEGQIVCVLFSRRLISRCMFLLTLRDQQDFQGQRLADILSTVLLVISGVRTQD